MTRGREGDGFFYSLQKTPPQTWVAASTYTTSADKPLAIAVSFETVPFKLILR